MQLFEECNEIHLSFADGHLQPQIMAVHRIQAVLGVQIAHITSEYVQRVHGIGLSVEDQIGRIQIDAQIIHAHALKAAKHGNGGFLARFKEQELTVLFQMLRNSADRYAEAREVWIIGIFRNEAHVSDHIRNSEQMSEVRSVAQVLHAHLPVFGRHKSQRDLPVVEIPDLRPLPAAPECGYADAVFFKELF